MKSSFSIATLLIISIFCFSNCELEDPELGITTAEIISLSASQPTLLANGESRITLRATLEEKADPNLDITFTTEAGSFPLAGENTQEITLTASGRTAEVILQSDNTNTGFVIVSAALGNYKAPLLVDFQEALADAILLSADRQTVTADRVDFAQITSSLFKENGMPTIGTRVNYEIIELDTARANIIPFDFIDNDLKSVVTVKSENGKPGFIQVKVSAFNQDNEEISEVLEIEFVE